MYHYIVKQKIRKAFGKLNQGDFEVVLNEFGPTFEHTFYGEHLLGGTRHSLEETRRWYERLFKIFPHLHFEIKQILVKGLPWNTVAAVRWEDRANLNGLEYNNQGVHFFRIQWGKVTTLHIYCDTERLAAACDWATKHGLVETGASPITG